MASVFLDQLAKALSLWRKRSARERRNLTPREFILEGLEERVNPANFDIDLANYTGTLQINSFGTGSADLSISQSGFNVLSFSSSTNIYVNNADTGSTTYNLSLASKPSLSKIQVSSGSGIQDNLTIQNLNASNFAGTSSLGLTFAGSSTDLDSVTVSSVTTIAGGSTTGGAIQLTGYKATLSSTVETGSGGITVTAPNQIQLAASPYLVTNKGSINLTGPVALTQSATLNTFNAVSGSGAIQISGSVQSSGGTNDLTLISGSATTTVTGNVQVGKLTLQSNATTSTGGVSLGGDLNLSTLTTFAQPYAVAMTGSSVSTSGDLTFLNTGGVTLGNGDFDTFSPGGGLYATASPVNLHAIISALGSVSLGPTALQGAAKIVVVSGSLTLGGLDTNGHLLDLTAGNFPTVIGGSVTLDNTVQSKGALTFANATVTQDGNAQLTTAGTLTFSGTTTVDGGGNKLGLSAADLVISSGPFTSVAEMTIAANATQSIGVGTGAGGQLQLDQGELNLLVASQLVIGNGSSKILVGDPATGSDTVSLPAPTTLVGTGSTTVLGSNVNVTGDLVVTDALMVSGGSYTVTATGGITITGGKAGIYSIAGQASNNLTLQAGSAVSVGSSTGFTKAGTANYLNNLGLSGSSITVAGTSQISGTLTLTTTGTASVSNLTAGSDITLNNADTITLTGSLVSSLGTIAQVGAGAVDLKASLTAGTRIQFASAITLGADSTVEAPVLKFTGAIDGAKALTLTGTTGTTLSSAVGSNTPLVSLTFGGSPGTITASKDITTTGNIALPAGAGAASFQNLITTGSGLVQLVTSSLLNLASVTTAGGSVTLSGVTGVTVTGAISGGAATLGSSAGKTTVAAITSSGVVQITGAGGVLLSGPISAGAAVTLGALGQVVTATQSLKVGSSGASAALSSPGTLLLNAGVTLTLGDGGTEVISVATVTGAASGTASNLTVNTSGSFTANAAISQIGTLNLTTGTTATLQAVTVTSATLDGGSGSQSFQGLLSAGSLKTSGNSFDLALTGNLAVTGASTLANAGKLTLGDSTADTLAFQGGLARSGGPTTLAGSISALLSAGISLETLTVSANSQITTAAGAVTIGAAGSATSISGGAILAISSTSGNIQAAGTVDGPGSLTLTTAGSVTFVDAIGTTNPLAGLTLTQAANASFSASVRAGLLTLGSAVTGTVTLSDSLTLTTGLSAGGGTYAISLLGDAAIAGATTLSNTGSVTIGSGGSTKATFTGGLTTTAPSALTLAGNVAASTNGAGLTLGDADTGLVVSDTLNLSTQNGPISLGAVTLANGTGLSLSTGTGAISLRQVTGASKATGTTLSLAGGPVTASGTVDVESLSLTNSSATFTATVGGSFAPNLTILSGTTGTLAFTGSATTLGANSAFNAGNYSLQFDSPTTTFQGDAAFNNTGSLRLGDGATDTLAFQGVLTAKTQSSITLAGTQKYSLPASTIEMGGPASGSILLTANTSLLPQTGATGLNIILGNTTLMQGNLLTLGSGLDTALNLAGVTGAGGNLVLNTTGAVTAAGKWSGLGTLTVTQAGGFDLSGSLAASTLSIVDIVGANPFRITGAVNITGNLSAATSSNGYGVTLLGDTTVGGTMVFNTTGDVTLGDAATDTFVLTGGLVSSKALNVYLAGSFSSTNAALDLGDVSLTADTRLASGSAPISIGILGGSSVLTLGATGQTGAVTVAGMVNLPGIATAPAAFAISLTGGATIAQSVNFTNTGLVKLGDLSTDTFVFDGALTHTAGPTELGGKLSTNNQKITLGSLGVSDSSQIDAGSEAITLGDVLARWGTTLRLGAGNSGPIQMGAFARNGASVNPVHLTFDTSGAIVVTGAIGQGVGTVTVTQADSAVFQGAVGYNGSTPSPLSSLVLSGASTAMSFLADLAVTNLSTGAGAFDLSFTGSKVAVTNGVTLLNTGAVTLGDSPTDSLAFTGGLVATASSGIQLGGGLATTNSALKLAPVTLLASASLATGSGAVTLAQLTGTGSENFTINSTGALTVSGPTSKVNALTLVNTGGATFSGALDASTLAIQDTTGKISLPAGATLGSLTTAAKAYSLNITGITVTAPVSLLNTGSIAMAGALAFDGGLTATAASSISLAGISLAAQGAGVLNLATTNPLTVSGSSQIGGTSTGAITLPALNLADGATLTLGAGATTPITTGAISGTAGGATSAITFDTLGAVSVTGAVGTDLGSVTLTNSGTATFGSTLTAGTVTILSATGTVTVTGNTTTTGNLDAQQANYALRLQGASNTIGGKLLLANQGTTYLGTTGTAKTLATGGISAQSGNTITAIGTLATAGAAASLEALSLAGNTLVDTTNGGAAPSGAPITFASVQTNGYLLTLNAGTGGKTVITDITLSGVFSSASPIEFAGKVTLAGNATLLAPAISFTSSGSVAGNSNSLAVTTDNFAFASGGTLADLSLLAVTSKTAGVAMGLGDKSGAPILLSDAFLAAADSTAGVALLRIGSGSGNGTISVSTADGQVEINTATKLYGSGSTTTLSSDIVVTGDFLVDDALKVDAGNRAIEATGSLTVTGGTAGIFATKGQTNNLALKAGSALLAGSTAGFGSATGSLVQAATLEGGSVTLGPVASKVAGNLSAVSSAGPLTFSGPVEAGVSVSVQSDNPISLKAITTGSVAGLGISQTGAGAVTLADNLTTTGGSISFDSAITLSTPVAGALVSMATTANGNAGAAISLQAVTGSASDLRLDSGKGSILVAGTVSGIDELQLQSAAATSTGSVTFQANLSANSLTTYAQAYAVSLLGDTVIQQATKLSTTGMATLGDGTDDDLTFAGGLTHVSGSTTIGGNLATTNQAITLATTSVLQSVQVTSGTAAATFGALTLADGISVALTSGNASFTTIDSATGGTGSLAIQASGAVQATGGIGSITPLGSLSLQSATAATFQGVVKAGTLDIQNKVTGTTRVDGAITLDTLLASAGAYNLSLLGGGAISNDVAFLNTGTLTLNASATNTLALGGTATATTQSSRTLAGTITSVGAMTLGSATLAAATSLTGTGGLVLGTVASAGNSLRVESGSGNPLTLGAMANLAGSLTLANSGAAATLGDLGTTTPGAITVLDSQGLVTFTGTVNATTLAITDSQAGVSFAGPVNTSGKLTITDTADGKLISFASTLNANSLQAGTSGKSDGFALSLQGKTVVTGTTTAYNTGSLNLGGSAATSLDLQGGLSHATGPTTLGGILTTSGAGVSLADLTLTANSTIRTQVSGLPGANLNLSGALDGGSYNLTIDLGTLGSLNAAGSVDKLGTLTLANAAQASFLGAFGQTAPGIAVVVNALASGGSIGFLADSNFLSLTNNAPGSNWIFAGDATTITQPLALTTTGSVQLGDGGSLITLTGGATVLAGAGITVNGQVQTGGNTSLTLGDSTRNLKVLGTSVLGGTTTGAISLGDLTLADKATLTLQGTSTATLRSVSGAPGATATALASTLTGALTVSGPVTGLSALTLNQGSGATFLGAVGTTGPGSLTVGTSVTGTVLFSGPTATFTQAAFDAGSYAAQFKNTTATTVRSSTQFNNTGGVWLGAPSATVTFQGNLEVTSSPVTLSGTVGTTGGGILFLQDTLVSGVAILDTTLGSSAGANIALQATLNGVAAGSDTLTLTSGSGTTTVAGQVGNTQRLGSLLLGNNAGLTLSSSVVADRLHTVGTGTGTARIDGPVTAPLGVKLASKAIEVASIDTSRTGAAAGDITLTASAITLRGDLLAKVTPNSLPGFNAKGGAIQLTGPVTLDAPVVRIDNQPVTGGIPGFVNNPVQVLGTIDGFAADENSLTVTGWGTSITVTGAIGSSKALTDLRLNGSPTGDITLAAITAASADLLGNNLQLGGPVLLTGDLKAEGATVTLANPATVRADNFSLRATQQITLGTGAVTLDGAFTQSGAAPVTSGAAITAGSIRFVSPLRLSAPVTLDTQKAGGDILLASVDSLPGQSFPLVANTASGNLVAGNIGSATPLASLSIASQSDVSLLDVATTGPIQLTAGQVRLGGNLVRSATAGIRVDSPVLLTGAGPIALEALGGDLLLTGTLDDTGSNSDFSAQATGTLQVDGEVGGISKLASASFTGGSVTLGSNATILGNLGIDTLASSGLILLAGTDYTAGQSVVIGSSTARQARLSAAGGAAATITAGANLYLPATLTTTASRDLNLATQGSLQLGSMVGLNGNYLRQVQITTQGGDTSLRGPSILLDGSAGQAAAFSLLGNGLIALETGVTIDTNQQFVSGGAILLGASPLFARIDGLDLLLNASGQKGPAGDIQFGPVGNNGGQASFLRSFQALALGVPSGIIQINGGEISVAGSGGPGVRIDGRAVATTHLAITSRGGPVALANSTGSLSSDGNPWNLSIDSSSTGPGGAIVLGLMDAFGGGNIASVTLDTSGSSAGSLTLTRDLLLEGGFTLRNPAQVLISGPVTLDTNQSLANGGPVYLGSTNLGAASTISGANPSAALTINTAASGVAGNVALGAVNATGGSPLAALAINAGVGSSTVGTVRLNGDVSVAGPVTLDGRVQLPASTTIASNLGTQPGAISLVANAGGLSALAGGLGLTLDTQSATTAGASVTLGLIDNQAGSFLQRLAVNTAGLASAGALTLRGNISLDGATAPASLAYDAGNLPGAIISVDGQITLDTAASHPVGGSVYLGRADASAAAPVSALSSGSTLSIRTDGTDTAGSIALGAANNSAGLYLESLLLDAQGKSKTAGQVRVNASSLVVNADSDASLAIRGDLVPTRDLTLQGWKNSASAGSITVVGSISPLVPGVDLVLNASIAAPNQEGGTLTLNVLSQPANPLQSITLNTRGTSAAGSVLLAGKVNLRADTTDPTFILDNNGQDTQVVLTGSFALDADGTLRPASRETNPQFLLGSSSPAAADSAVTASVPGASLSFTSTKPSTIALGSVEDSGGAFLAGLNLNAGPANPSTISSAIHLNGGIVSTRGDIQLRADNLILARETVLSTTNGGTDSGNVVLDALISGTTTGINLAIDTSTTAKGDTGGTVFIRSINGLADLTLTTSGPLPGTDGLVTFGGDITLPGGNLVVTNPAPVDIDGPVTIRTAAAGGKSAGSVLLGDSADPLLATSAIRAASSGGALTIITSAIQGKAGTIALGEVGAVGLPTLSALRLSAVGKDGDSVGSIHLGGDIRVAGPVSAQGKLLLPAATTIDTTGTQGGEVRLADEAGVVAPADGANGVDLTVQTGGTQSSGSIWLGRVGENSGTFLNDLWLDAGTGAQSGSLHLLGGIALAENSGDNASFTFATPAGKVWVHSQQAAGQGVLEVSTAAGGSAGSGDILLGGTSLETATATLLSANGNDRLGLLTAAGTSSGNIGFGQVVPNGANLLASLSANALITNTATGELTPNPGTIRLNGSRIETSGPSANSGVSLAGNLLLTAATRIDTNASPTDAGGSVQFTGTIAGTVPGLDLAIDTSAPTTGGAITLSTIVGLRQVTTSSGGSAPGQTTLQGDILLEPAGGTSPLLQVNDSAGIVIDPVAGAATLSILTNGGDVRLRGNSLSARSAGQSLFVNTNLANQPAGAAGAVLLPAVGNGGGSYLAGLSIDAGNDSDQTGTVTLSGDIVVVGPVTLDGTIALQGTRTITTQGESSLVRLATGSGSVSATTPGQTLSLLSSGGTVELGLFDRSAGNWINQLRVDTRGASANGPLVLRDDLTLESLATSRASLILQSNNGPLVVAGGDVTIHLQGDPATALPGQVFLGGDTTAASGSIQGQGAGNTLTIAGTVSSTIAFGTVGNGAGGSSDNFLAALDVSTNGGTLFANTGAISTDGAQDGGVRFEGNISFKPAEGSTLTIDTDQSGINPAGDIELVGFVNSGFGLVGSLALDTRSSGSFDSGDLLASAASITLGGDLTARTSSQATSGDITLGRTTVAGTTRLDAGTGTVLATHAANDFTGPVHITTSGDLSLRDANRLTLGDIRLGAETATLRAGEIFQADGSVFTQEPEAQLTQLLADTGPISLPGEGNVLTGPLNLVSGGNGSIQIANAVPLVIAAITMPESQPGTLSLDATGGISQTTVAGLAASGISTGTGAITLDAGAGAIALASAANRFRGELSAANTGVSPIEIRSAVGLLLDTLSMTPTAAGTLKLTAPGISQTADGTITTGTGAIEILPGTGDLLLANAKANAFNGPVTLTATGAVANLTSKVGLTLASSTIGSANTATSAAFIAEGGDISDAESLNLFGPATFTTQKSGATITLDQLNTPAPVTLSTTGAGANATLVNAGPLAFQGTVGGRVSATANTGGITDSGPITFGGGMTLRAPGTSLLDNDLASSGSGGLTFQGSGSLTIAGTGTYTGSTVVNDGKLVVNGSIAKSLVVVNSGTLMGTGTVGSVSSLGDVRPGNSPGILTSTGVFTLIQPARLGIEINGAQPGTGYDQVVATQGVILNTPTLDLKVDPAFDPASVTQFVLVNNLARGKVQGTFAGLPEGTLVPVNGVNFVLSYRGGTGNDVTLSRFSATPILVGSGSAWSDPSATGSAAQPTATVAVVKPGESAPVYLQPFGPGKNSGVTVANGIDPATANRLMLAGAGPGGSSAVKLIDITRNTTLLSLEAFPGFQGGVYVALADVNSDNSLDVIVGAGQGGEPSVAVFNGKTGEVITRFFAYAPGFRGGVRVAAADTNNDGRIDIVTGSGVGARGTLNIFDGADSFKLKSAVFTLEDSFQGGVYVGSGDLNNDGRAEVIVGAGQGTTPTVVVYQGGTDLKRVVTTFNAYDPAYRGGVRVGTSQQAASSATNITTGSGAGAPVDIRVFDGQNFNLLDAIFDVLPEVKDGVYVG